MSVTINANGLSIVHKGSGGEANATLPDVCLTTVGNAVVPIPYGNNAKSADLVEGTTTVTADGGNSIALKDSKFAKSSGDAGGDKKVWHRARLNPKPNSYQRHRMSSSKGKVWQGFLTK